MEDVPQPLDEPYSIGDEVRVYLSSDDPDSQFNDLVCEVVEIHQDDLGEVVGRDLEAHHYQLKRKDSGEVLPLSFRHADLVPNNTP